MANQIRFKRASGSDPTASDLVLGEPAVRTDTGELFFKKDNGSVAKVSGGGISDGDKGDITVSNSGDTFTIDSGVVTSAKIADGTIVNADINASAAIAGTKISPDFGSQNIVTTGTLTVSGNIGTNGTVAGRDMAADGSKLDGIESGATADQTASEILTLIKTVDGSGSGLDADTLDGISSASFLRSDADDSFSGTITANSDATNPIIKVQGAGPNFIQFASDSSGTVDADSINFVYRTSPNTLAFERASDAQVMFSVDADNQQAIFAGNLDVGAGLDVTGNISVSGTVDGRDVASDGSKLDGIESGATADQSASEILTLIKTVDGAGSGLDADTLDGISSASFVRSDADDSISGFLSITNDNGLRIRTSTNAAGAKINFSDQTAGYGQNGTLTYKHADGSITTTGGNSNDGWVFEGSETRTVVKVVGDIEATSNIYGAGSNITALNASNLGSGTVPQARLSASTLLTLVKTVDGSGSGLDADLLDGISSGSFVRGDATNNGATEITVNDADFIVEDTTDSTTNFIWRDHSGSKLYLGTSTAVVTARSHVNPQSDSTFNLGANGTRWANIYGDQLYGAGSNITGLNASNLGSGTVPQARLSASTLLTLIKTVDGSGSGLDADNLDGRTWSTSAGNSTIVSRNGSGYIFGNFLNMTGTFSNSGNTSGMSTFTGTNGSDNYGRSYTAAAARALLNVEDGATADQSASEILTLIKTVDGAGSGLDADTVDGISSGSFLRSDADDVATRRIQFQNNATDNEDTIASSTGSQGGIEIYNSGAGNDAFMAFHSGSDFALYFGLDADINDIAVGGWSMGANKYRIWHQNNDGSGSGLDADTVDGVHGTSFLRSDTTDTASGAITFNGDVGFNGGAYAAHIEAGSDIAFLSGDWSGNHTKIQNHSNYLYMVGGSNGLILRHTNGSNRWQMNASGHFLPSSDSSYDLGTNGNRVRNGYFDTLYGDGSNLTGISAGATGGGSDEIFYENGQTVTTNYTITNGKNAMCAGPITINSGVTVTVGSGENLTIV